MHYSIIGIYLGKLLLNRPAEIQKADPHLITPAVKQSQMGPVTQTAHLYWTVRLAPVYEKYFYIGMLQRF